MMIIWIFPPLSKDTVDTYNLSEEIYTCYSTPCKCMWNHTSSSKAICIWCKKEADLERSYAPTRKSYACTECFMSHRLKITKGLDGYKKCSACSHFGAVRIGEYKNIVLCYSHFFKAMHSKNINCNDLPIPSIFQKNCAICKKNTK